MKTLLLVNGALAGAEGNTDRLLAPCVPLLEARGLRVEALTLTQKGSWPSERTRFEQAAGFLFGSGTYWDSWSSHLQRFLEEATDWEGTQVWLGKPAGVLVTGHEAGAKGVLTRLQGVLVTLGCQIPPMSGLAYTQLHQIAQARHDADAREFWNRGDLEVITHNLAEAVLGSHRWKAWPVSAEYRQVWAQ